MREPFGTPLPSPSTPPEEPPMSLRIDLSAHAAARSRAHDEGCSISEVLLRALRLGLQMPEGGRPRDGRLR